MLLPYKRYIRTIFGVAKFMENKASGCISWSLQSLALKVTLILLPTLTRGPSSPFVKEADDQGINTYNRHDGIFKGFIYLLQFNGKNTYIQL